MGKTRSGVSVSKAFGIILSFLFAAVVLSSCWMQYIPLKEGSFLYSVLSPVREYLDTYINFFPSDNLTIQGLAAYGLVPVSAYSVLVFICAVSGLGFGNFILGLVSFCSAYLSAAHFLGEEYFYVTSFLPGFYFYISCIIFLFSFILLLYSVTGSGKQGKTEKTRPLSEPSSPQSGTEEHVLQTESSSEEPADIDDLQQENGNVPEEVKEPEVRTPVITMDSKRALRSLMETVVPEFRSFQNYTMNSVIGSVDKSIFDVSEREAAIRAEAERKKKEAERKAAEEERLKQKLLEEERARKAAEEERKKLENMFKPRNLMKRLSEEARVEKEFPSYRQSSSVDYGFAQIQSAAVTVGTVEVNSCEKEESAGSAVTFVQPEQPERQPESKNGAESQSPFTVPPSQQFFSGFSNRSLQPEESVKDEIPASDEPKIGTVFKEAAIEAEKERRNQDAIRAAEQARKEDIEKRIYAEKRAEQERLMAEIKAAEEARIIAEARAKAMEEAKIAAEAEAERIRKEAAEARLKAQVQESVPSEDSREDETSDDELDEARKKFDEVSEDNQEEEKSRMPDIDEVSGVAGLKSSTAGTSYLIDRQKFEYHFPPESLLKHYPISATIYEDPENDPEGQTIVDTLKQFRIDTQLIGVQHGPTFTLYELSLQKGIKVTAVLGLAENIAMELSVADVRILAPIPGKPAIGVEVPNKKRDTIGFDVMMPALKSRFYKIPMVLGRTITGDNVVIDLAKTPHLLVAGTTGSGKSVCINGLICSVLYTKTPKEVRMILVDPKMVELSVYNGIPHLLTPVVTDAKKALKVMNFVVEEMERRMTLFSAIGAKKIDEYNEKIVEKKLARVKLPYIMVIIDEFADLMMAVGKELESSIKRITAVARFCGIHLVLATQRPSADVITGIIKSNIPTQIAFAVSNFTNSKIIIDQSGAEKLLGRGDMLFNDPAERNPKRIQGAYIDSEIESIVDFVKTQGEPDYIDEAYFEDDDDEEEEDPENVSPPGSEDMLMKAWKVVSDRGEASASLIQRKLKVGYNRAANLIEELEEAGYVGPARGSKPREVLRLYGSD